MPMGYFMECGSSNSNVWVTLFGPLSKLPEVGVVMDPVKYFPLTYNGLVIRQNLVGVGQVKRYVRKKGPQNWAPAEPLKVTQANRN